jgi:hypothetical protein
MTHLRQRMQEDLRQRNGRFMLAFEQNRTVFLSPRPDTLTEQESIAELSWYPKTFPACESAAIYPCTMQS